jgi:threonine dehydratase
VLSAGLDHVAQVSDDAVEAAMRALYADTHNLAEGAGAGAMQERSALRGQRVGVVLTEANVDAGVFAGALQKQ